MSICAWLCVRIQTPFAREPTITQVGGSRPAPDLVLNVLNYDSWLSHLQPLVPGGGQAPLTLLPTLVLGYAAHIEPI